jgi:hypothetical protein
MPQSVFKRSIKPLDDEKQQAILLSFTSAYVARLAQLVFVPTVGSREKFRNPGEILA